MSLESQLQTITEKSQEVSETNALLLAKKLQLTSAVNGLAQYFPFQPDSIIRSGDRIMKVVQLSSVEGTDTSNINYVVKVKYPMGTMFGDPKDYRMSLSSVGDWSELPIQ